MMGFGAGHILDMLKRYDQNRDLQKNRKGRFLQFPESSDSVPKKFDQVIRTDEEMALLREELKEKKKKKNRQILYYTLLASLIILPLLVYLFIWLYNKSGGIQPLY